ncbi:MAG: hypothetical protein JWQ95_5445 [Sphaerisporangium sp.]|nr:hypothetical protein [Sphaerisporangium sp.]
MRHPLARIATTAVAAPLAGALLFAATPASAAPAKTSATTTVTATKAAAEPDSSFSVKITAPKKVKAGGTITYRISAVNTGPWEANAYYLGGKLPKGIVDKVYFRGDKGTECGFFPDGFWCLPPYTVEKGEKAFLTIEVKLKKSTKGSAVAKLGVDTYDYPQGAEDLNRDEFERLGIKGWYFLKSVKTKIVR